MKVVAALGRRVEERWKAARLRPDALPAIAAAAIEESAVWKALDGRSTIARVLDDAPLPPASHGFEAGDDAPVFPLYASARVAIDLHLHGPSLTTIHDHDFSGAVVSVEGISGVTTYAFDAAEDVAEHVRTGLLRRTSVARLTPGKVATIHAGSRTIHRMLHASDRNIVLVVRSRPKLGSKPQRVYFEDGLAFRVFARGEAGRPPMHDPRASLLGFLGAHDPAAANAVLKKLLTTSDAWSTASLLLGNWAYLQDTGALERTLRACKKRLGPWIDRLADVARTSRRLNAIRWGNLALDARFAKWATTHALLPRAGSPR